MLRQTPFHARTAALCESQAWRRWAGYVVASSYELTHDREYHAIRSSAALLDGFHPAILTSLAIAVLGIAITVAPLLRRGVIGRVATATAGERHK